MSSQHTPIRRIVILGGGAAGWLAASILAASRPNGALDIVVVESPDVPILGVGEGTWPTMRGTLQKIGIDEQTFLRACDASFKQGTCFHQWLNDDEDHRYYHPFSLPFDYPNPQLGQWWQHHHSHQSFAHTVCSQATLCDYHLAPKQLQTPPYAGVVNYGYHLDANKFAQLLKQHATEHLGVTHVIDHIDAVIGDTDAPILGLQGRTSGLIKGDFFVDCSGFAARLIGQHYQQPLTSCQHILANDSAVAIQAHYEDPTADIASVTHSTTQPHGWIWDIALPSRKGVGYVYSSAHCSDDEAKATLANYLKSAANIQRNIDIQDAKQLRFSPGYRQTQWQKNCVAIGTSAGFLEPLEASALVMIEMAASHLAEQLPSYTQQLSAAAQGFNQVFSQRWQRIVDFLKLHYVLSQRQQTAYWQQMSDINSASEQLKNWLTLWQTRGPLASDFSLREEIFPAASFLYVLYGMHQCPQLSVQMQEENALQRAFQQSVQSTRQQLAGLPTNRQLLTQLHQIQLGKAG